MIEVRFEVILCPLIFYLLPNALVFEPRLPQLHRHLSDRFCDMITRRVIDAGVEAR